MNTIYNLNDLTSAASIISDCLVDSLNIKEDDISINATQASKVIGSCRYAIGETEYRISIVVEKATKEQTQATLTTR